MMSSGDLEVIRICLRQSKFDLVDGKILKANQNRLNSFDLDRL